MAMTEATGTTGSPGQAAPRPPVTKVRRLAENWPPKPHTNDDAAAHPLLAASGASGAAPPVGLGFEDDGAEAPSVRVCYTPTVDDMPPPPPPLLIPNSPPRPLPPAVQAVPPVPRVPRQMSEQRDRASDFEPLRFLGKGTFGAVVLVRRRRRVHASQEGRRYAMKIILKRSLGEKSRREMAMVEREILRTVRHPFLVSLACSFQSKTRLYLVTPYLCGGDLDARLKNRKTLTSGEVRAHIARLSLAVDFLHRSGVIHRDIKGANVLLDAGGRAHLADFGLAAYCDDAARPGRNASFAGTLDYMAPELFLKSAKTYDGAVDYWSLGVLAYQCLVGVTPFSAPSARELFTNILRKEPVMDAVLEEARDGIRALLHKKPDLRDALSQMRRRPFFGEAILVWRRVADADDPLGSVERALDSVRETKAPDRDFDRYLSHDGERPADVRPDLFAGYAYRAPDERGGGATSPMILRPPPRRKHPLLETCSQTSQSSSVVSSVAGISLSSGNSHSSGGDSLSSGASDRSVKRGHRRTTSRAMGSIIALTRTFSSQRLKDGVVQAKKKMARSLSWSDLRKGDEKSSPL